MLASAPTLARRCALLRRTDTQHHTGWPARPTRIAAPPGPAHTFTCRPEIRRDYPLNLSISLSGGKETNKDSPSSGERSGKSPAPNPLSLRQRDLWCIGQPLGCRRPRPSPPDRGLSTHGGCRAFGGARRRPSVRPRSRVVWECSPKRVVNSI